MLAIIIPAHNEADRIKSCILAAQRAVLHPGLGNEVGLVIVAVDACSDGTEAIVRACGVDVVTVEARNVGVARAAGASFAIDRGARWLAFTDADTIVADDWLVQQLRCNADAVCGVISVNDWTGHSDAVRQNFVDTYCDADGHRHIHGANLGVSVQAYVGVGGFAPLDSDEDVTLVRALVGAQRHVAWSAAPRVVTSARLDSRAHRGFGATLREVSRQLRTQELATNLKSALSLFGPLDAAAGGSRMSLPMPTAPNGSGDPV